MNRTNTLNALIRRLNRKLAKDGERLCITRDGRWWTDLGDFYIIDACRNVVQAAHIDPEGLARELGVMHPNESMG